MDVKKVLTFFFYYTMQLQYTRICLFVCLFRNKRKTSHVIGKMLANLQI